ncbi:MAG: sugar-transfer associated ATP-grasp domain-containing protein [Aestuariivirga sp.]|uniref:sugar-transfer associated ATP-grasp domain-containing protein n=1 Tax=Aestuariivirga sp. TaxID=2650926 RepID=UPI0038D00ACB
MSVPPSPDDRLSLADRFATLRGAAWKALLRQAEALAYLVAGLPMALWRAFRGKPAASLPPAEYLHRYYAWTYWRLPWGPLKAAVAAVMWPVALIAAIWLFTGRNGKAIAARSGVSVAAQALGQADMAARHAIAPFWYYMFELYLPERGRQAGLYLTAHETIGPAYALLQPPEGADFLDDKIWFAEHCHAAGVRAVPVFMHFSKGERRPLKGGVDQLPEADLFVKPRSGAGGHRMERWDFIGGGRYRDAHGTVLDGAALVQKLARQSLKDDFLVQPRLKNHPALDDIANGALATVRLLTCRDGQGRPEAANAAFRMAIGNSVVDNFHQGGLATAVNLATGEIGIASDIGVRPEVGWRDTHPVSGARFAGRILPHWPEVVALAIKAHEAFPQRVVVGWDVAMLEDGAMIIEGNGKPDLDIHQRAERRPLGGARIAELLAHNVARRAGNQSKSRPD